MTPQNESQNFHSLFRGLEQIASDQQIEDRIQQIVAQADRDNSGTVDLEEFSAWYQSVYLAELDGEARRLFVKLDTDKSGSLDREELKSFVEQVRTWNILSNCVRARDSTSFVLILSFCKCALSIASEFDLIVAWSYSLYILITCLAAELSHSVSRP